MTDEHALGDLGDAAAEFAGAHGAFGETPEDGAFPTAVDDGKHGVDGTWGGFFFGDRHRGSFAALTTLSVGIRESGWMLPASRHAGGEKHDGSGCCDHGLHWIADWDRVCGFGVHQPDSAKAGGWCAGAGHWIVCEAAWVRDAVLVRGQLVAADCWRGCALAR